MENISLQQSGNNNDNGAVCDDDLNKTSHNNDLALDQLEDQEKVETEPNLKTITIEEYKNLMQLMLQVKKNEETIKKMEEIIKLKDAQLKNLRSTLEEGQSIQVCHLSNVSIQANGSKYIRPHQLLFYLIVHIIY